MAVDTNKSVGRGPDVQPTLSDISVDNAGVFIARNPSEQGQQSYIRWRDIQL